ncbi:hypothetical protein AAUPMC_18374, partial [Pasteurella multocida subsp. multocida str. Anand1_cattle]
MQLAIISYALSVALFIPLSGWLADKYGTLKIFCIAVSIFVSALLPAPSLTRLIPLSWR